jgi:hypothetical protein
MKLKQLTLTNFQGIRSFTLDTNGGKNVSIFADNAIGKTSLYNAFLWLLFEKNSLGAKDFDIKTRDENGQVIPAINHEVEAVLEINDKDVTLKRVFLEKFTKKRGSAKEEFTGHDTEHFIDGVPKTKGEYQAFIDSIAPEKLFMVLTSPTYFNEQLDWKDRRRMLLGLCPEITDADIFQKRPDLEPLRTIIATRDIDDAKKVEMATRKKINEELTGIPGRIDEATRAIPENSTGNLEQLATKAQKLSKEIDTLRESKIAIISGGDVASKQRELSEIENDILTLRNKHLSAAGSSCEGERQQLHTLANEVQRLELQIDADKRKLEAFAQKVEEHKAFSRNIAGRWKEQNGLVFVAGGNCPTCGQDYPEHLLHKQEADFNRTKATELELIAKEGQANESAWKESEVTMLNLDTKISAMCREVEEKRKAADQVRAIIESKATPPPVETLPEFLEMDGKRQVLAQQLADLTAGNTDAVAKVTAEITERQRGLDEINATITAIESAEAQRRRIEELKSREKELAEQFEQSEHVLYLIEQFIQAKVGMLEESINGKFSLVNFRLFEQQINGGLSETCVATVNGVPYPSVNNGARIQSGAEIVAVFQSHYGINAPCFFDNRESVTSLPDMPCQTISLIVSAADKALRIEIE